MSRIHSFASLSGSWLLNSLDSATDGILVESRERVVYANEAYARLLKYRRAADLVSRPLAELIAEPDAERLIRFGKARIDGQKAPNTYDFAALRSDGSTIRLQASVSLTIVGGHPYIMTIARRFAPPAILSAGLAIAGEHDSLSAREREVMNMLLEGKRPKAIAFELGITENTVATHRTRLLEKLGVTDNRGLFQYALRHGLVDWS